MKALSQEMRDGNRGWGGWWCQDRGLGLSSRTWSQLCHLWRSWQDPRDSLSRNLNFSFASWNEASLPYPLSGCCQGRPWSLGHWGWAWEGEELQTGRAQMCASRRACQGAPAPAQSMSWVQKTQV